jgi:hypothetical protein
LGNVIVLFAKYDVLNVLEDKKIRLKAAYLALPENDALDENVIQQLKVEYMLDVPVLKTEFAFFKKGFCW